MQVFNKSVSKQILCVENNVHMLIDETNSLIENDAQDKEIEPDLATKDLVLMHEGKCSEAGSGPEHVSKEEWQGYRQTGGTAAEPCLGQNKENISRNRSQNLAEQEQKQPKNRSRNMFQNRFQKQDLRLFLKMVHQEIKLEMIVWLRIYLFHDHGSTKFTSLDQILSNINSGVLNLKIIVLSMFSFLC